MRRAESQKHLLTQDFDPIKTFVQGVRQGVPWESIVDFATHKSFCGKRLYPRQKTALKLMFLETEHMTDYDRDVIDEWRQGWLKRKPEGVQPDVWDRIHYLQGQGYDHFPHIEAVMGRRASKGLMGGIVGAQRLAYMYSLGNWQEHYQVDPGLDGYLTVIATNMTQAARFQFNDIRRTVENCKYLQPHISTSKENYISLRTPADLATLARMEAAGVPIEREIATIRALAMSSNSASGRGGAGHTMFYDEFAHMISGTGGKMSSEEVYEAYQPSLDQFHEDSLTYIPSSPFTMVGKFYELYVQGSVLMPVYNERLGLVEMKTETEKTLDEDAEEQLGRINANPAHLILQLPSWALYKDWRLSRTMDVNNAPWVDGSPIRRSPNFKGAIQLPPEESEQMRLREQANPEKFAVERRAQFASVIDAYLDPIKVERMFMQPADQHGEFWHERLAPQDYGRFDRTYVAHADPGRTNANFAFAIAHLEPAPPDEHGEVWPHVIFDYLRVWKPQDYPEHTIDYVEIGNALHDILNRFRSTEKMSFDQWNSAGFIAQLRQAYSPAIRIVTEDFNERSNQKRAELFKSAINLGWVHCYRDTFYQGAEGSLLELELKFLQETKGKVVKQDFGPVTTKDLADCVMTVTANLLHAHLDRWANKLMGQMAFGSSNVQQLRSPAGLDTLVGPNGQARGGSDSARGKLLSQRQDRGRARNMNEGNRSRGSGMGERRGR